MAGLDLIEREVDVDDDEVDESFDEETGEVRPKTNGVNGGGFHFEDSSEEEDDDDDEEAARAVCPLACESLIIASY
jgi:transcription elongation factor SPT6